MLDIACKFSHGLGDAVQFTSVLLHLRKYRPDWYVDVFSLTGKDSAFKGLCRNSYRTDVDNDRPSLTRGNYYHIFDLAWMENYNAYSDCPSTKITNCLREVFGIEPDLSLCHYQINVSFDAKFAADKYFEGIGCARKENGRYNAVLIHYEGNTSPDKKNLNHECIRSLCQFVIGKGYKPIILDWDSRSPLPDQKEIFCPNHREYPWLWYGYGTGDAERIAALIESASLFLGIDSGPGKVASSTKTPTIINWVKHHPMQFHDLSDTTTHLVPVNHRSIKPVHHDSCFEFFQKHYQFEVYEHFDKHLIDLVARKLGEEASNPTHTARYITLKAKNFHIEYYQEHKQEGLDYLSYGDWQRDYGKWIAESLDLRNQHVLDVGCACGSIAHGMRVAGILSHGIDLNNPMIEMGKKEFPNLPLYVCDAVNLHLFGDNSFQCVHHNQVAEHWRKDLVPWILRELYRVLKPGGIVFAVWDTLDLFLREKRNQELEDPTNNCIESMDWWKERYDKAGFQFIDTNHDPLPIINPYKAKLMDHPTSYFKRYNWDWLICQKPSER